MKKTILMISGILLGLIGMNSFADYPFSWTVTNHSGYKVSVFLNTNCMSSSAHPGTQVLENGQSFAYEALGVVDSGSCGVGPGSNSTVYIQMKVGASVIEDFFIQCFDSTQCNYPNPAVEHKRASFVTRTETNPGNTETREDFVIDSIN